MPCAQAVLNVGNRNPLSPGWVEGNIRAGDLSKLYGQLGADNATERKFCRNEECSAFSAPDVDEGEFLVLDW